MLAQAALVADLGAWTGWGSFGVTGLALGYLLVRYLPARDREAREERAEKDRTIREVVGGLKEELAAARREYRESLDRVCADYEANLRYEREVCQKQFELAMQAAKEGTRAVQEVSGQLRQHHESALEYMRRHEQGDK